MLIDWFTVCAQALNFLVLAWLLKRFLYKPVLHAIDSREALIAKELADADSKQTQAHKERDEFQHKNEQLEAQRAALLTQMTDEVKTERLHLVEQATQAADTLGARRQAELRSDALTLNQAILRRTQQEVFSIARKALADLASTSLEERLSEVFIKRLSEMDSDTKIKIAAALKTVADPALVRSAFDLPAEQRTAIHNALNETFSTEVQLRFEASPDLISGIELTTNGLKISWNIADYLTSLTSGVDELLVAPGKAEATAGHEAASGTESN